MANTQPKVAVKELTIVSKTKTSISIRWNKATDLETPQSKLLYTVTWCVAPYRWDNNIRRIGERKFDNNAYTITGLEPNTTYDIIVYVRDTDGYENTYAKTTVKTLPATLPNTAPTIPNKTVYFTKINSTTVEVSWQKATDKETAQRDLRYIVTWVPGPTYAIGNRKMSPYMTDVTSYRITGLYPGTQYMVKVYVYDGKDHSAYNTLYVATANPQNTPASINSFLSGVGFSPEVLINNELYNESANTYKQAFESLPDREAAYVLTRQKTNVIEKYPMCVRGEGYEKIYPGAILLVDSDLTTGNPNTLNVKRAPITLYGDFLAGSTTTQPNVNPNNEEVREASNRIMRILLKDSNYEAPGTLKTRTTIHTSKKSLMMDFKVDANFAGVSLKVNAKTDSQQQTFIQATTMEQNYFTVRMKDTWRQDPSSLFDKSVTVDELRKAMNGKAIAIVTSVTYGRTFSYLREYSSKKYTFDADEKVSGYGQSASSSQHGSEESTFSQDDIFNLGGTSLPASVLRSKKTQAELEQAMADNIKFGPSNQGVVTEYTLVLVSGTNRGQNISCKYSGSQYQMGYVRCPRKVSMYVNVTPVRIGGSGGGDVAVHLDVSCFRVVDNKPVTFKVVNGSCSSKVQDPWWYKFNSSRTRELDSLQKGEYIGPNPTVWVESRASKASRWTRDDSRLLENGEIADGKLNVYLDGDVAKRVKIKSINPK